MAVFTPHGLKIRFDEQALEKAIEPLKRSTDFNDVMLDVELWEILPSAMAKVAAIITAFLTGSWLPTLVAGIIGLLIGGALREITYSDLLRRLFPLSLGSGPVTIVAAIACGIYLGPQNEFIAIAVLGAFFFPITQIESIIIGIFLAPIIYFMGRHSIKSMGIPTTHVERVFISVCNNRARKLGIQIDWHRSLCLNINS